MGKGRVYHDKPFQYEDPYSGREVVRLTDYRGHSNHFYFTDPCWFNRSRSLLFTSDREGQGNLFRYDLDTYTITQVTDLKGDGRPRGCISPVNNANYYWWEGRLIELNLTTLAERVIWEVPPGFSPDNRANPTADGKYVLYSSDLTRYANIYRVEVGNFDDLPLLTDDILTVRT